MQGTSVLDAWPFWLIFIVAVGAMLVAADIGYRLGVYRRIHTNDEKEAPVGAMVGSTLGLLAFMLAFTFNLAAMRFDDRRGLVLQEANALGTTYLRTTTLPEGGAEIRALLREYTDLRIDAAQSSDVSEARRRSEEIQTVVWGHATTLGRAHPGSIIVGLFIESLNEVIDVHSMRLAALRTRIPGPIWIVLVGLAVIAFTAMGYHAGLAETRRTPAALAVTVCFALVIILIVDLDRPFAGFLRTSQQPMIDARQGMQEP